LALDVLLLAVAPETNQLTAPPALLEQEAGRQMGLSEVGLATVLRAALALILFL